MVSVLAFTSLLALRQTALPLQIVPISQNQFERKQTIKESGANEKLGIYIFNDFGVSDKAYEAIVAAAPEMRIVKLIRKEADGQYTQWAPDGRKIVDEAQVTLGKGETFEPGDTAIVFEMPTMGVPPESSSDKPLLTFSIVGGRASVAGAKGKLRFTQKLPATTAKFADIRVSARVTQFVGSFKKDPGTTATIEDVNFKVLHLMPEAKDKRDHLEIAQSGIPNVGSFLLYPTVDWDALAKDGVQIRNRNAQGSMRVIREANQTPDPDDTHLDVSSVRPFKYWSGINVYRNSNISGYLGHVAMQPNRWISILIKLIKA